MPLRPYQQAAHDAAWNEIRQIKEPCLIEAATGAGKSHIIAALAKTIHDHTGKKVLCLAPSAELVVQNREKYIDAGYKASTFSASAGAKDLRHPVVFGSPLTVKNRISRFRDNYAAVIVDEAHGITPTLQKIIAAMREGNEYLRVIGMTATPYRMGSGYIFSIWPDHRVNGDDTTRNPYFSRLVYRITAPELIEAGYLTKPVMGEAEAEGYDTSGLEVNAQGKFDADAVDRAYHGKGRLTADIVEDVVRQCRNRMGVLFFAATIQHAQEVLESLPPELSRIVTGQTPAKERKEILAAFKARRIKYLVNVAVLTTGFDAPHVDCIAILRKTESAALWSQIVGRGLRLHENKNNCLVLDYTDNIEFHFPDGDIFSPSINAGKEKGTGAISAVCEGCGYENHFTPVREYSEDTPVDENGYFIDLDGNRVMTDHGPLPAHHGRRCINMLRNSRGEYDRCGYRWTSKECPHCEEPNDIAARFCTACKGEIVDPNEKLRADFKKFKSDPTQVQTDKVWSMSTREGVSGKGNKTLRVDYTTEYRTFSVWLMPEADGWSAKDKYQAFLRATSDGIFPPETVTYRKNDRTGFYEILGYNMEPDHAPEQSTVSDLRGSEFSREMSA